MWGFPPSLTNPSSVFCFCYCWEKTSMACTSTIKGSMREKNLAHTSLHIQERWLHPARQAVRCTLLTGSNPQLWARLQNSILKRGGRFNKPYINASSSLNLQINYKDCTDCRTWSDHFSYIQILAVVITKQIVLKTVQVPTKGNYELESL